MTRSPGLHRGFAVSGAPQERIYLQPTGFLAGAEAEAACAGGLALPLAGGPLAFTLCEILVRRASCIEAALATIGDLREWSARQGASVETYLGNLLAVLSAPREPFAGLALDRPRLMGIVNATPDSFSDGGDYVDPDAAVAHGSSLIAAGADIIDIGGESTRPGAIAVNPEEEIERVRPVLAGLAGAGALLSIDTRHAAVMAAALDLGAAIVNDVSALAGDPASLPLAAARGAAVVLMHMQGEPRTMNLAPRYGFAPLDVYDALAKRVSACIAAGIPRSRIAIDPGLGFGKKSLHNYQILGRLALFHGLGCPILIGASRKFFVSNGRGAPPKGRLGASVGAALAAADQGAHFLRVHDVEETRQVLDVWRASAAGRSADPGKP